MLRKNVRLFLLEKKVKKMLNLVVATCSGGFFSISVVTPDVFSISFLVSLIGSHPTPKVPQEIRKASDQPD